MMNGLFPGFYANIILRQRMELHAINTPGDPFRSQAAIDLYSILVPIALAGTPGTLHVSEKTILLLARTARIGAAMEGARDSIEAVHVLHERWYEVSASYLRDFEEALYLHDIKFADRGPIVIIAAISIPHGPECGPIANCRFASDVGHHDTSRYAQLAARVGLEVCALRLDAS